MQTWMTAAEIATQFMVGEAKLLAFASRGNLPSRLGPEGERLFALAGVERLFPRRGAAALEARTSRSFGTLGGFALGASADEANRHISHLPTKAAPREDRASRVA